MANPISVVVRRGGIVEATHLVHAAAVREGALVAEAGDPQLVTLLRSSAKPLQALPLARAYGDLEPRGLAIASASHLADDAQLDAVRALLEQTGGREAELECGAFGDPPSPLKHNCSGKHAGMIAVCRAHGWPVSGYRLAGHAMQDTNLSDVADAAELDPNEIPTAVDGCGVLTFALSLERMAFVFAHFQDTPEGSRVADAMREHPDLIRGPKSTDTLLMKRVPGVFAKGGAEGLLCGALPDGTGFAVKQADGGERALRPALAALLAPLGFDLPEFAEVPMENNHGEHVGTIATA